MANKITITLTGTLMEVGDDPDREDDGPFIPRPRALIDTGGEHPAEIHGLSIEQAQTLARNLYKPVTITVEVQ